MKARGYAYVFPRKRQQLVLIFSAKGGKIPFKKHQILMSAVTFSANGPWKQFLTKWKVLAVNNMKTGPAILSWKILYHQRWRTKLMYHFIPYKSCVLFSVILKVLSGWEVIRTQVKINVCNKILWLSETSLIQRMTVGVISIVHARLYSSGTTGRLRIWIPDKSNSLQYIWKGAYIRGHL